MIKLRLFFLLLILITLFSFFFKKTTLEKVFPDRSEILIESFSKNENFFPIATIDLTKKGIKDKIHILYVSFDPEVNDSICFPKGDNKDNFSFDIEKNGKLKPTFNDKALKIGESFEKYFLKAKDKYEKAKTNPSILKYLIDFSKKPEWWQSDETPINSKGVKYKFICQVEIDDLCDDDCKMFVFYDNSDNKLRVIYQRD